MTDLELIARVRQGDTAAFNSFYHRHHESLWRFLYYLEHNETEARDLFQEVWLRLTKLLMTETPVQNPRALLFQMAANCRRDHLRRKRVRRIFFLAPPTTAKTSEPFAPAHILTTRENAEHFELEARLATALTELSEAHRQVFLLKEWEGFGLAEIAALLGIPVGTVKSRLHHAVRFLQNELRELREYSFEV